MAIRKPKKNQIEILFEDRDMIVVSKPAGLLTVPIPRSSAVNLQQILKDEFSIKGDEIRAAHRIDRYTTGIVVFSRNPEAHDFLKLQFIRHKARRVYWALVHHQPPKDTDTLVHYMKQVQEGFRNIVVAEGQGTMAQLKYKVLERFTHYALVETELVTGLKNQIRVQFAHEGFPIFGDRQYEGGTSKVLDRQALHAVRLEIIHPRTKKNMVFNARLPQDIEEIITVLRLQPEIKLT